MAASSHARARHPADHRRWAGRLAHTHPPSSPLRLTVYTVRMRQTVVAVSSPSFQRQSTPKSFYGGQAGNPSTTHAVSPLINLYGRRQLLIGSPTRWITLSCTLNNLLSLPRLSSLLSCFTIERGQLRRRWSPEKTGLSIMICAGNYIRAHTKQNSRTI